MFSAKKKVMVVFMACLFLISAVSVPAMASEKESEYVATGAGMLADLAIVRPVSLAATIIGTACFIVSLPFNPTRDGQKATASKLIEEPAEYTFVRPLGVF